MQYQPSTIHVVSIPELAEANTKATTRGRKVLHDYRFFILVVSVHTVQEEGMAL